MQRDMLQKPFKPPTRHFALDDEGGLRRDRRGEAREGLRRAGRGAATLPTRLDRQGTMLAAHLSAVQALEPLYASFSDEQKKIADGLMIGPMGLM